MTPDEFKKSLTEASDDVYRGLDKFSRIQYANGGTIDVDLSEVRNKFQAALYNCREAYMREYLQD